MDKIRQESGATYVTTDITLATALTCREGFYRRRVICRPPTKEGEKPYCEFHIGCDDEVRLKELVQLHHDLPEGLQVGSKTFDRKKKELRDEMVAARLQYEREQEAKKNAEKAE